MYCVSEQNEKISSHITNTVKEIDLFLHL